MSDPKPDQEPNHPPHVVVHPVSAGVPRPYRRVDILGAQVGKAYSVSDVAEFMRRAGLDADGVTDPGLVQWQGGDVEVWG
jgi:hypothetical protein